MIRANAAARTSDPEFPVAPNRAMVSVLVAYMVLSYLTRKYDTLATVSGIVQDWLDDELRR